MSANYFQMAHKNKVNVEKYWQFLNLGEEYKLTIVLYHFIIFTDEDFLNNIFWREETKIWSYTVIKKFSMNIE